MSTPTILVTGATGKIGTAVTEQLLEHGEVKVRALVRRKDGRSERLQRLGAELVLADLFDPQQVEAAVRGVQRIAYVPPWHPHVLNSGVSSPVRRSGPGSRPSSASPSGWPARRTPRSRPGRCGCSTGSSTGFPGSRT